MTEDKRRFAEALYAGAGSAVEAVRLAGRGGTSSAQRECARRWRRDPEVVSYLEDLREGRVESEAAEDPPEVVAESIAEDLPEVALAPDADPAPDVEVVAEVESSPAAVAKPSPAVRHAAAPVPPPGRSLLRGATATAGPEIVRVLRVLAMTTVADLLVPDPESPTGVRWDIEGAIASGAIEAVRELDLRPDGTIRVRLYDRLAAIRTLDALCRPRHMTVSSAPATARVPDPEPVAVEQTPEDRREAARARLAAIRKSEGQ